MTEFTLLLISTALVNNVVLVKFLGLCPFLGVSKKVDSAVGMGLATTFVLTLACGSAWLVDHWVLTPLNIGFMRILTFILVIAAVVQFTEMVIRRSAPALYQVLGIYLPLITTNCAILAVAFLNIDYRFSILNATCFSLGTGLGFMLVIIIFAALRERLELAPISRSFRGYPIAFIAASLASLAFMGFVGLFGLSLGG